MGKEILELVDKSNETILNAIRAEASLDYQNRIPEATQANLQDVLRSLQDNRPGYNEFVDALVNRIGLTIGRNMIWQNRLAEFKIGMLSYGDSIEEYAVGLLQAHTYEDDREAGERAIFGTELPEVKANIHKRNRKNYYKVSINEGQLNAAFLTPGGISDFVTKLMQAPATSDQWDEFLLMTELFAEYEKNGGFHKVHVAEVSAITSDEAAAKDAIRKTQTIAGNLLFPSTKYNAARMPTFANPDELVLFATPEYQAAINVEALAGAFNPDNMTMPKIYTIPKERFNIPGVEAILTTRDFFVVADTIIQTEQARNPVKMMTNYFLHHQGVISASTFVPAVAFTTMPVDEDGVEVWEVTGVTPIEVYNRDGDKVTEVLRGEIYNMFASATTAPADGPQDAVRFSVEGATSPRTRVTNLGVLHVGGTEGADTLTIRATAVWTDSEGLSRSGDSVTATVTVSGRASAAWPVSGDDSEGSSPAATTFSLEKGGDDGSDDGSGDDGSDDGSGDDGSGDTAPDYSDMTVVQLQEVLTERGLDTSGTKPVLLARLADDDAAKATA